MLEATEPNDRQLRQRNERLLVHLLSNVNLARAGVRADRSGRGNSTSGNDRLQRRAQLLEALEAYAAAAASSGVPLPYRYRDEMRLYRSIAVDPRGGALRRPTPSNG
jgi:hypothetical protein